MKVVINSCYGGFGLSRKAMERYAELKGFPLYAFANPPRNFDKYVPADEVENPFIIYYYKTANREEDSYFSDYQIERNDPVLIEVVKELGVDVNGRHAKLEIVDVPDDAEWEISEYDGYEHVAEKHRTWP